MRSSGIMTPASGHLGRHQLTPLAKAIQAVSGVPGVPSVAWVITADVSPKGQIGLLLLRHKSAL